MILKSLIMPNVITYLYFKMLQEIIFLPTFKWIIKNTQERRKKRQTKKYIASRIKDTRRLKRWTNQNLGIPWNYSDLTLLNAFLPQKVFVSVFSFTAQVWNGKKKKIENRGPSHWREIIYKKAYNLKGEGDLAMLSNIFTS